ncbi:MAG: hypothetical protein L6Q37_15300 [Bdellovibrionaceae bacterium]|nr:hypothetical protein [Pseudobdellovibrionaceae bacterium]NUM58680.1 hypothetical protein [Pseudobdellovibrionaceae bacterium]
MKTIDPEADFFYIEIPGKTFLSGEYLALYGGPSLTVSTGPGFKMFFVRKKRNESPENTILYSYLYSQWGPHLDKDFLHISQSPAGLFYAQIEKNLSEWEILFYDGYQRKGGFGASTAQFLGLFLFHQWLQGKTAGSLELKELIRVYWKNQASKKKFPDNLNQVYKFPSGHDLLAQCFPGFHFIKKNWTFENQNKKEKFVDSSISDFEIDIGLLPWPFSGINLFLVFTGNKIPTHIHLEQLQNFNFDELLAVQEKIQFSFKNKLETEFIVNLKKWRELLNEKNFVCSATIELVKKLESHAEILFAKGCGALGSDVLFVLGSATGTSKIKKVIMELGLGPVFDHGDVWQCPVEVKKMNLPQ